MYTLDRKVGYSAIYKNGKMRLGAFLDYMQDCEWFQIDSEKTFREFIDANNYGVFLVYRQVDIIRIPEYAENVSIKTWIHELSRIHGVRNTNIYDEEGNPCIVSFGYGPFMDLKKNRPGKVPEEVLNTVLLEEKYPMEYLSRKISIPKDREGILCGEAVVGKSYIDSFNHMNNARYPELALEYIPEEFEFKRVRIEYKKPAVYGEKLIIFKYDEENSIKIVIKDEEGSVRSILEFSR